MSSTCPSAEWAGPAELQAFIDTLPHAVLIADARTHERPITAANRAFLDMTGFDRSTLLGASVLPIVGAEADPGIRQQLREAVYAGHIFKDEWPIRCHGGTLLCGRILAQPLRGASGALTSIVVTIEDVTEYRRGRESLKTSEARLELAMGATDLAMWDWDVARDAIQYDGPWRDTLGVDPRELLARESLGHRLALPPEEPGVMERLDQHLRGYTSSFESEYTLSTGCGRRKRFLARAKVTLRDAQGQALRVIGGLRELPGIARARAPDDSADRPPAVGANDVMPPAGQAALPGEQNFYNTILESLPLLIAYADADERVVYANRFFQDFFSIRPTKCRCRRIVEVIGDERYEVVAPTIRAALAGETVEGQAQLRDAAGRTVDLEGAFIPHRDDSGRVLGCFLAARDVTERRQLEAELRQSQKMEAVGRLTGGVAHDFNNLLSVIVGNMQLLGRSLGSSPRLLRQTETALNAALRGAELTRRLLAFARQQVLEPKNVDLNALIAGMYELLRRTLTGQVELRRALDPQTWPTKVDPGQLENAVLNLVINARDAMPAGGSITLRTRNVTVGPQWQGHEDALAAGEYAVLEVADTGAGMSAETLKRVCEPFFTTKDVGKGSGLGLSIVYGFVKQSGGHLHLTSTPGWGTTVRLYFPRTRDSPERASVAPVEVERLPCGSEMILVVEDNMQVRATAVDILSSLGYQVIEASNGQQALEQCMRHEDIALMFSDIMLPGGLLGTELAKRLLERRAGLKVLLTSGFSESSILHQGLLDGSIELLPKPYTVEELARRVRAKLDGNRED